MNSRDAILTSTITLLASEGYSGASIRDVAAAASVQTSVIYHYFGDKEGLFRAVRVYITQALHKDISVLEAANAGDLLRAHLQYQFEQRELLVALLQYFIAIKKNLPLDGDGYVPKRAYEHTRRLIERGVEEGRYKSSNPDFDAKVVAHMVNGFLIEYYPHEVSTKEAKEIVESLAKFIEQGLGYSKQNSNEDQS